MIRYGDGAVLRRFGVVGLAAAMLALPVTVMPAGAQAPPPSGPPAVPVTVTTVMHRDIPILLRNIGAVQAMQTALMRSRVDGTLEKVFFQEGQEVKHGDALALIDPRPYQAALDQAIAKKAQDDAQLANARLDLGRSVELAVFDFALQLVE